jgi:putative addiction module component (TIGR02574 family)
MQVGLPVVFSGPPRYIGDMADMLDIARLTTKERLDLIAELWDSLAPEDVRLTPVQEAELGRRMATFDADTKAAVPWEDVDAELGRRS